MTINKLNLSEIIETSFNALFKNVPFIFKTSLFYFVITLIPLFLFILPYIRFKSTVTFILFIIGIVIVIIISIVFMFSLLYYMIKVALNNKKQIRFSYKEFKSSFSKNKGNVLKYFCLELLYVLYIYLIIGLPILVMFMIRHFLDNLSHQIIFFIIYIALLIYVIIFSFKYAVIWFVYQFMIVDKLENKTKVTFRSLINETKSLIKGRFWKILGFMIIGALLAILISSLFELIIVLLTSLSNLSITHLPSRGIIAIVLYICALYISYFSSIALLTFRLTFGAKVYSGVKQEFKKNNFINSSKKKDLLTVTNKKEDHKAKKRAKKTKVTKRKQTKSKSNKKKSKEK